MKKRSFGNEVEHHVRRIPCLCNTPTAALGALLLCLATTHADVSTVVVLTGDSATGNGTFSGLELPSLNDLGQVAFYADLTGTSGGSGNDTAIYRGDGTTLVEIVREGDPAPDGNGVVQSLVYGGKDPAINDAGQVLCGTTYSGATPSITFAATLLSGGTTLEDVVRGGDPVPGGSGQLSQPVAGQAAFNDSGLVGFPSNVLDPGGNYGAMFVTDGTTLTTYLKTGDPAPDGNGIFPSGAVTPHLNDAGQAAFIAGVTNTSGGIALQGLFRGDGTSLTQIARRGDAPPSGNGTFDFIERFLINESGQVSFEASIMGTSGGTTDNSGIYVGSGGSLVEIARKGDAVPTGTGNYGNFEEPVFNDLGQVAFSSDLTSGGVNPGWTLFRSDGTTTVEILREGDVPDNGDGIYNRFANTCINSSGQLAFQAIISNSVNNRAIMFYDDTEGLITAVRVGDACLGSTVSQLDLQGGLVNVQFSRPDERNGFNELGQIAYWFKLLDGREGISIWSPPTMPPPTTITVTSFTYVGSPLVVPSFTMNWTTNPPGAGVDVYRTIDFVTWTLVSPANTTGTFTDTSPPIPRAFYVVVPQGQPYP